MQSQVEFWGQWFDLAVELDRYKRGFHQAIWPWYRRQWGRLITINSL